MFNLVYKDLAIQKKSLVVCFLFIIFYNVLAFFSKDYWAILIAVGLPFMLQYLFVANTFLFDEKNKSYIVLNSLPVGRKNIVISRYLSSYIFFIAVMSFDVIFSILINGYTTFKIEYVIIDFIIISITNAICLPLYFKFGYAKLKYILMIMFFSIWFVWSYIDEKINYVKILDVFKGISYFAICNISAFCAVLLVIISLSISIRIYSSKELV